MLAILLATPILPAGLGVALILIILWDAVETILVPRRIGRRVRLTRYFYRITWRVWRAVAVRIRKPSRRQALLGFFGPVSLILLLLCWAGGLILGFALLAIGTNGGGAGPAGRGLLVQLYLSGETFFTLGFGDITPATSFGRMLAVIEAGLGFGFLGTVVGYLPTMYSAFSQREIEIALLDARAGSPPAAAELFRPGAPLCDGPMRDALLATWERWSAQLLETHISYPQLAYYRSQHSNQSWLSALVTILDSTSLLLARSGSSPGAQSRAGLTFAMARHALVDITQIFVTRFTPGDEDRLNPEDGRSLRTALEETAAERPVPDDFENRLAELRLSYEAYAQALAAYLLFDLPPWINTQPRHDNWRGGPWDRLIRARRTGSSGGGEEHF